MRRNKYSFTMSESLDRRTFAPGHNAPQHRKGHRRGESMYAMTGLYADCPVDRFDGHLDLVDNTVQITQPHRDSSKCHSRNPSAGIVCENIKEREKELNQQNFSEVLEIPHDERDCGILSWRPMYLQRFSSIKVFVFFLSILVTLQQALSSGYINSVITTIEKRFEIPSSLSGLIASSYEIGNVITVIFVSYLGSRRHIPVWIAIGAVIMGIGSLIFVLPHFVGEINSSMGAPNVTDDNICRAVITDPDVGGVVGRLGQGISPHNNLRTDNCIKSSPSTFVPVTIFLLAQLLLGCGGSPLLTLGTTYVDDHVKPDSASLYIGCMYSMAAFGPVLGFLLGAYLLSFHMDSLSGTIIAIDPGDHRWIGMWWGGFLLCGLLLILVAIPFFSFPKELVREKEKIRLDEKEAIANGTAKATTKSVEDGDTAYGRDIKDIPVSMWRLIKNPVYVVTCLGACMELMIVSGFVVFLPKYLETQFSLGKSHASVLTGSVAIPGACIGIFFGGCLLKRLELRPKGAVQFVLISNTICLACYGLLFFLGCDNVKMAGTTIPYYSGRSEPFTVNLTAACNFGCSCTDSDVEPVCGNNGLTYFSPCHAGCTAFSSRSNYTNCACIHGNISAGNLVGDAAVSAALHSESEMDGGVGQYAEVTVVPVARAGTCTPPCTTIFPFLVLLFFMTFVVAVTQMPLLMIVLRSVSEEERSFALGMQFVIFRLFGYIPAPILFGNLIDSTCILWKSSCGEKGGRCLLYDIEQFRFRYVGLCGGIKLVALGMFACDWWLVRRAPAMTLASPLQPTDYTHSVISLDKLFEENGAEGTGNQSNTTGENANSGSPHVLVATRHVRNDSRSIQLESKGHSRSSSRDIAVEQLRQLALKSTSGAALVCRAESEGARLVAAAHALRQRRQPRHRRTASHHLPPAPPLAPPPITRRRSTDRLHPI